MLPRVILLLGVLAVGCFSEAPMDPSPTTSGNETGQPTTTTTPTTSADTTAGIDPVPACRECQAVQCEGYEQACMDTVNCNVCTDQPFGLPCLMDPAFRPLAYCSCDGCAEECGYMCPGGGVACQTCFMDECQNEMQACTVASGCTLCLIDPYRDGCAENAEFMAAQACACERCEAPCLWQCPGAITTCSTCFMGGACGPAFNNCIGDVDCDACFANPTRPGCETNMLYEAVGDCVCANCPNECGLLFECG